MQPRVANPDMQPRWVAIQNANEYLRLAPTCHWQLLSHRGEHRDIHLLNGAVKYLPLIYLYDYDS